MRLRTAVIGVGHLGKEHARILAGLPDVELVAVADVNLEQARAVAARCHTEAYGDYWPLLNLVDAAIIAVPTAHHHAIAVEFLRRGIPLLIEKPIAIETKFIRDKIWSSFEAKLTVNHAKPGQPAEYDDYPVSLWAVVEKTERQA